MESRVHKPPGVRPASAAQEERSFGVPVALPAEMPPTPGASQAVADSLSPEARQTMQKMLPCVEWGCTCQGASNAFGITHDVTFGKSEKEGNEHVKAWWLTHHCTTTAGSSLGGLHGDVADLLAQVSPDPDVPLDSFVTFTYTSGRVNNNLIAWASALALAQAYNRTLIIPYYPEDSDTHLVQGTNTFIGVLEGFWDLLRLKELGYKFVLRWHLPEDMDLTPGDDCVFKHTSTVYERKAHEAEYPPNETFAHCRVLHFHDAFGLFNHRIPAVREHIRPAGWLRRAAERWLRAKFPPEGVPAVSVHQRHHAWGNKEEHGSKYLCRGTRKRIWDTEPGLVYRDAVQSWAPDDEKKRKDMLAITQLSCGVNLQDVKDILQYWKRDMPSSFFLASDRETPLSYDVLLAGGAIVLNASEVSTSDAVHVALDINHHYRDTPNCGRTQFCPSLGRIEALTAVVLDMWTMATSDFYIGGYYSTMSETVCHWRGLQRMEASNICFLPQRIEEGRVDVREDMDIPWMKPEDF